MDVFERLRSEGALPLLRRFYGFHQPIEAALQQWAVRLPEFELHRRTKTSALERDLRRAGLSAAEVARLPRSRSPSLRTSGEVLGVLYVVEGSTLGGRAIHKACRGLGIDRRALSFFDVYGADTGALWRRFCAALQAHGACADTRAGAARAAVRTFAAAEDILVEGGAMSGARAAVA